MRRWGVILGTLTACNGLLGIPGDVADLPIGGDGAGPDVSEAGATVPAAEVCPVSTETDECFKCTDEKCCVEYAGCHGDPRCGQYFQTCIPSCEAKGKTYAACVVECDATNHGGHVVFAPYNACSETHCLAPCAKGKAADLCLQCSVASCIDTMTACYADADCDTFTKCASGCKGGSSCVTACRANKSTSALMKGDALFGCWATYCIDTCAPP